MNKLQVEYISIDKLTPYRGNARKHGKEDVEAIEESILTFGFNDPIAVWGEENLIVEGHGRLEAAKELNMKELPCIRLDGLTDEERKAYALAHNKTAELSAWDFEALEQELSEIEIDMGLFGFENESAIELEPTEYTEEHNEADKIQCHCPKCGFYFEVER